MLDKQKDIVYNNEWMEDEWTRQSMAKLYLWFELCGYQKLVATVSECLGNDVKSRLIRARDHMTNIINLLFIYQIAERSQRAVDVMKSVIA
jgi:hypothetical protein